MYINIHCVYCARYIWVKVSLVMGPNTPRLPVGWVLLGNVDNISFYQYSHHTIDYFYTLEHKILFLKFVVFAVKWLQILFGERLFHYLYQWENKEISLTYVFHITGKYFDF